MNVLKAAYPAPATLPRISQPDKSVSFTGTSSSHPVIDHKMEYASANIGAGALSTILGVYTGFIAKGMSKIKTPLAAGIGLATAALTYLVTKPLAKYAARQQIARKEATFELYDAIKTKAQNLKTGDSASTAELSNLVFMAQSMNPTVNPQAASNDLANFGVGVGAGMLMSHGMRARRINYLV